MNDSLTFCSVGREEQGDAQTRGVIRQGQLGLMQPGSGRHDIPSIGSWLLRGENGAVTITLGSLTRLRSNPFWTLIDEEVGELVAADLGK